MSRSRTDLKRSMALTALVGSPRDMWEKLHWNLERYSDELEASTDGKSVCFAALDYSKTAVALHEWVNALITQQNREEGKNLHTVGDDDIRWQGAVRSIANATKHPRYSDKHWPGGSTTMGIVAPEELRGLVAVRMTLTPLLLENGARWEFMLADPASFEPVQAGDALLENFSDWDGQLISLGLI